MKIVSNGDNYIIYVLENNLDDINIKDYVKKIILKVKDKLVRYISGFYEVDVYSNNFYGIIIEMFKKNDFDFFKDFIELDINIDENSTMYFEFDDYFVILNKKDIYFYDNKYYVNIDKLNSKELLKMSEYGKIVYGSKLNEIENKLQKINFVI